MKEFCAIELTLVNGSTVTIHFDTEQQARTALRNKSESDDSDSLILNNEAFVVPFKSIMMARLITGDSK